MSKDQENEMKDKERLKPAPTVLITDFSRVILHPTDPNYKGTLNGLHREKKKELNDAYNILDFFTINQELLDFLLQLKQSGVKVIIYTSETIQEDPGLRPALGQVFETDDILSAQHLGVSKQESDGYNQVLSQISAEPGQVVFLDDSEKNLVAARETGITTVHHQSNTKTIEELRSLFLMED